MKTEAIIFISVGLVIQSIVWKSTYDVQARDLFQANLDNIVITRPAYELEEYKSKYRSPIMLVELTSAFGYRECNNKYTGGTISGDHKGLDMVGPYHCEIYPIVLNGIVEHKWYVKPGHPEHGGYVVIKHKDGWKSGYSHLSAIYVKEGDQLINGIFYRLIKGKWQALPSEGRIGRQGDTGQSKGEHLHLTIENELGKLVNPLHYINL